MKSILLARYYVLFVLCVVGVTDSLALVGDGPDPQGDAQLVSVRASGIGLDISSAKKAASRAAIEQVVGQILDAETLVENDELVRDRILTYSGAFIEDLKIIGNPTQEDGLWIVNVLAKVRKTTLVKKLEAAHVTKNAINGESLFHQLDSQEAERDDAVAMISAQLERFPYRFVKADVAKRADGSPSVRIEERTGKVIVDVDLSIDTVAYKDWAKELGQKLEKMASCVSVESFRTGPAKRGVPRGLDKDVIFEQSGRGNPFEGIRAPWGHFDESSGFRLALATAYRPGAGTIPVQTYSFSGNNADALLAILWERMPRQWDIDIALLADDDVVGSKKVVIQKWHRPCLLTAFPKRGGMMLSRSNANFLLAPFFFPDEYGKDEPTGVKEFRVSVKMGPYSKDILADVTDVQMICTFFTLAPGAHDGDMPDLVKMPK